jgi:hypothetical protein
VFAIFKVLSLSGGVGVVGVPENTGLLSVAYAVSFPVRYDESLNLFSI